MVVGSSMHIGQWYDLSSLPLESRTHSSMQEIMLELAESVSLPDARALPYR